MGNELISFEVHLSTLSSSVTAILKFTPTDSQDWVLGGCHRICRSRRAEGVLLSGSRLEGSRFFLDILALQGES